MTIRLRKVSVDTEKKVLTWLITDTEFCEQFIPFYQSLLPTKKNQEIEYIWGAHPMALISKWVVKYFEEHQEAPHHNFELFYQKEIEPTLEEIDQSWCFGFLNNLSKESEKGHLEADKDISYKLKVAEDHFKKRRLESALRTVRNHLDNEANPQSTARAFKAFDEFIPIYQQVIRTESGGPATLADAILPFNIMIHKEVKEPPTIISPWLTDGSLNMLYGARGVGKTYLALALAVCASHRGGDNVGKWERVNSSGVLYVDGEMREYDIQQRLKQLWDKSIPPRHSRPLEILSEAVYRRTHQRSMNLADQAFRDSLSYYLQENTKGKQINLLIIDNLSALCPSIDENVKKDWDPIGKWLLSLRHINVAVLFIHHSGKAGAQRGTSGREDALDTIIEVSRPEGHSPEHGLRFRIKYGKARNLPPTADLRPFVLQLTKDYKWEVAEDRDSRQQDIREVLLTENASLRGLKEEHGWPKSTIGRARKNLIKEGLLDRQGKPTKKGLDYVESLKGEQDEKEGN